MNITVPTLLIDKKRLVRNVKRMQQKAINNKVALRPHLKTPQSNGVGEWLREMGIEKIAVSSLRMAAYYAKGGWKDITVAFPLNVLEMDLVNELAASLQLHVLVESIETLTILAASIRHELGVYIEIDAGYGRTGMPALDMAAITEVVEAIAQVDLLHFTGFLIHAGHTYKIRRDKGAMLAIHQKHSEVARALKAHFLPEFPRLEISYGDTPSCSMLDDFSAFDELRPGNFVCYDLTQYHIGSCALEDIAVAMLCPVVALHPKRSEIVVYGGGVHFSKDRIALENGTISFGRVVDWKGKNWTISADYSYVRSLSQEHGVIKASPDLLATTKVGDLLAILPVHSCMTIDLMPYYLSTEGEEIGIWDKS
ncbi:MAG: alanine racemase [Bacteroidota bacterium]